MKYVTPNNNKMRKNTEKLEKDRCPMYGTLCSKGLYPFYLVAHVIIAHVVVV